MFTCGKGVLSIMVLFCEPLILKLIFPVNSALFFDEARNKLFISFNYQLTFLEFKPEVKDRIMTHDKPVVSATYNATYNQVN